jgi:ankyrin repeat protein
MHLAAGSGRVDVMRMLVQQGAKPDEKCDGYTPLMAASVKNKSNAMRYLLSVGANLLSKDPVRNTMRCIGCQEDSITKFLLCSPDIWPPTTAAEAVWSYRG